MIYGFSDIECNRQIFVILGHFLPFYPLTARKIKIKNNPKKSPRDIIILHMCTKNYDQMMYGSWDMVCDGCNYFSFWAIFCHFILLAAWKIKIKKKKKKMKKTPGDIVILRMCTKNYDQVMHGSWDMLCDRGMKGWTNQTDGRTEKVTYRVGCPT